MAIKYKTNAKKLKKGSRTPYLPVAQKLKSVKFIEPT
jgi:hypothetical protein